MKALRRLGVSAWHDNEQPTRLPISPLSNEQSLEAFGPYDSPRATEARDLSFAGEKLTA